MVKCWSRINRDKALYTIIQENPENISISFCSMENVYTLPHIDGNLTYLGNTPEFWNTETKLDQNLKHIYINMRDGGKITVFDKSTIRILYSVNIPRYGSFLETCHSWDIWDFNLVQNVEVVSKKSLNVYVHLTGQLFHPGRQGFSAVTSQTSYL